MAEQIREMKGITMRGMLAVIDTIHSIDENSKKMAYKQFVQSNVNILAKETPGLSEGLMNVADQCLEHGRKLKQNLLEIQYDSDLIESDSSGNYSESDEINKFYKLKSRNFSSKQGMDIISDEEMEEDRAEEPGHSIAEEPNDTDDSFEQNLREIERERD